MNPTDTRPVSTPVQSAAEEVHAWKPVVLAALAGGLGWGIRGQYGHETGAMIAGLLVSLVLALCFCAQAPAQAVARAVAWGTIAIGIGGSMTYGQTVGLTHDPGLVGNWAALRWGMLGLAIKGALWIGFAGVFLGMGLGGIRYRTGEILGMMLALLALAWIGIRIFNQPFEPANRILPRFYFSADWRWLPDAALKPRREVWGGLLCALLGLLIYTGLFRRDPLALRLGLWAMLGGAIGFPLGQSLQAYHSWNVEWFRTGPWANIDPILNWWNFMETTFGTVMGATLGLGLWLHRRRIGIPAETAPAIRLPWELALLVIHLVLLVGEEFMSWPPATTLYDFGLGLVLIPLVTVAGGRWWPWLVLLPVTALPIAGKTLRELGYKEHAIALPTGWAVYVVLPLVLTSVAAIWLGRRAHSTQATAGDCLRPALLLTTWLYFGLNFAFFRFPWFWQPWTPRTPNAVFFTVAAVGLTLACLPRKRAA